MRLLNVDDLEFRDLFANQRRPRYVAASHRWSGTETSYQEVRDRRNIETEGYKKVKAFANHVRDNLPSIKWLCIDTACINRESQTELGKSINLMFSYYKNAEVCLAYLADVKSIGDLDISEWFARGWTLQELLAPRVVIFTTKTWEVIGNKGATDHVLIDAEISCGPGLESQIATITGIPESVLKSYDSSASLSIEDKRQWMRDRMTTEEEDMVYALYGICGVAPGVNYGEGRGEAERKLNRAIREKQDSADQAIFSAVTNHNLLKLRSIVLENPRSAVFAANELGQTALHIAAKQGDLSMVRFLLRNEAVVNAEDGEDRLPLHYAVISGNASVVHALLSAGADKTVRDLGGLSPRDLCNSSSSLSSWFLDHGSNLEAKNSDGLPALCLFARRRDITAVRDLLELRANIDPVGPDEHTPLFEACKQNHAEMVELLLNRGANILARNSRNDTVMCQVGWHGHTRIGEILLDHGADIDAVNDFRYSALHECCDHGHVEMALMLLRRGARFDMFNKWNNAPIHQACRSGHIKIVRKLLESGDDVNRRDSHIDATPIGEASQHGHADIVQLLLSRGAEPNQRSFTDGHHQTPLMRAAAEGHTAIVDLLLNHNPAHIEAQDEMGATALLYAVTNGRIETTKQLVSRKPNLEVRDRNIQYTPLHFASQACNANIVHILLEAGANPNVRESHRWTPIHEAAARGQLEIVQDLLRYGADPDPLQEHMWSPLRLALRDNRVEVASFLLRTEGVDIDSQDHIGETPLHQASERGFLAIVQELIQRGASVDRPSHAGLTALHFAARGGRPEVAKYLIEECHVNVNVCDQSGGTPLDLATVHSHVDVMKVLLERGASKNIQPFAHGSRVG